MVGSVVVVTGNATATDTDSTVAATHDTAAVDTVTVAPHRRYHHTTADPTMPTTRKKFADRVLRWFDRHGRRSLPWQGGDAYRVWVAEVMLQQTQVATALPYYRRFVARFPDAAALAAADPDAVLHAWSGLGYYARARNLHAAARVIVADHGGAFPDDFDAALALPGVGRSTAGAVLSAAFGRRCAVLDGNVKRVLARHYAVVGDAGAVTAELWRIADDLTPTDRAGDYNQAMMDLGASVCTRAQPKCDRCPLADGCEARRRGTPTAFPQRKTRPARPRRSVTMLLVKNARAELLLVKRPPVGVWGGLWSLPEYADDDGDGDDGAGDGVEAWFKKNFGHAIVTGDVLPTVQHSFTHFDLSIRPLPARLADAAGVMDIGEHLWYNLSSPATVGLPAPVKRIIAR